MQGIPLLLAQTDVYPGTNSSPDTPTSTAPETSAVADFFDTGAMGLLLEGGPFMWPILFCAVFALAIAFERLYFIMFQANINGTAFMAQVQKLIMANNIDRAIKLCNAEPNASLPRVLKAGLTRANRSEIEIQNAVDESVLEVFPVG